MSFTANPNINPDFMNYMAQREAEQKQQVHAESVETSVPAQEPVQVDASSEAVSEEPAGPSAEPASDVGANSVTEPSVPSVPDSGERSDAGTNDASVDVVEQTEPVLSDVQEDNVQTEKPVVPKGPAVSRQAPVKSVVRGQAASVPASPRRLPGAGNEDLTQLTTVRVSRDSIRRIRGHIPGVSNHADAVSVCLRALFGDEIPLSAELVAEADRLRETLFGHNTVSKLDETVSMQNRLLNLERQNQRLLRELQLGIIYLLGDRMNMDVGGSSSPDKVDFLWGQYDLLYRRLKGQTKTFQKDQSEIDGRERYEALNSGKEMDA